jgi:hypothetical protein
MRDSDVRTPAGRRGRGELLLSIGLSAAVGAGLAASERSAPEPPARLTVRLRHDDTGTAHIDAALRASAPQPGQCTVLGRGASEGLGDAVVAQLGQPLRASRDQRSGRYRATLSGGVDDLRWQPVSVWTEGTDSAGISSHRVLRLPEPVEVARSWEGPLGSLVVVADRAPEEGTLALEVDLGDGAVLRCGMHGRVGVLPPGTAAALGAPVWLATVRPATESIGGTAVVGEGISRVALKNAPERSLPLARRPGTVGGAPESR